MATPYTSFIQTIRFRKRVLSAIPFLMLLTIFSACKKSELYDVTPATIQPINLLSDDVVLYANLSGRHPISYSKALRLANKTFEQRNVFVNSFPQKLDFYALPDTMPHHLPVIRANLQLQTGKIYSMFIHGEKAASTYTISEDNYPAIGWKDSLTYIRFANFSEDQAISVNIKGQAPGSFIQSLPFKSISALAELKVRPSMPDYEFEVRDQVSGNILATYKTLQIGFLNLTTWIFKPHTLIFTGRASGTGTNQQKVLWMKHR